EAWRTNNRATIHLIGVLPPKLWSVRAVEGDPKTVREIAAHMHDARCRWIKTLGSEHGIRVPKTVDRKRVTRRQLVSALKTSSDKMEDLLVLGLKHGGELPRSKRYVWQNLALDVVHVVTYFVAHEAHHRGQITLIAHQAGLQIPRDVAGRLWWWRPPR